MLLRQLLSKSFILYGKQIIIVLPTYNAARTLEKTMQEIPTNIVDEILLIDNNNKDETIKFAQRLGLRIFLHKKNFNYKRNQKTCYTKALRTDANIIIILHPDYQYQPH